VAISLGSPNRVVIRINSLHSDACQLGRGVKAAHCLHCCLIGIYIYIYIQQLIVEALENTEDGVKVNGLLVKAVRFPDDQAMVSSSNAGLQRIIDELNKISNDYGMKINIKKTQRL